MFCRCFSSDGSSSVPIRNFPVGVIKPKKFIFDNICTSVCSFLYQSNSYAHFLHAVVRVFNSSTVNKFILLSGKRCFKRYSVKNTLWVSSQRTALMSFTVSSIICPLHWNAHVSYLIFWIPCFCCSILILVPLTDSSTHDQTLFWLRSFIISSCLGDMCPSSTFIFLNFLVGFQNALFLLKIQNDCVWF